MKPIKTLDELKKELMSKHGAVYITKERFRLNDFDLEIYLKKDKAWRRCHSQRNHGFLWNSENWYYYEKPKKIVKEEIDGFVD